MPDSTRLPVDLSNKPKSYAARLGGYKVGVTPFLKWAGGKRWIFQHLSEALPSKFGRYIEPFVGSGAVFFALEPTRALLADSNGWLIETYQALKETPQKVKAALARHARNHCNQYYYAVRSSAPRVPHQRAANLIYLNRTCWNALFRVNRQGASNVPRGTKNSVLLPTDDFSGWSSALTKCELRVQDFEATIAAAKRGDVVYADPPYVTTHVTNGFIKYNEKLFTWEDQVRLSVAASAAASRGATVIISNSAHKSIRALYKPHNAELKLLRRSSVIAASSEARRYTSELLIVLRPRELH